MTKASVIHDKETLTNSNAKCLHMVKKKVSRYPVSIPFSIVHDSVVLYKIGTYPITVTKSKKKQINR